MNKRMYAYLLDKMKIEWGAPFRVAEVAFYSAIATFDNKILGFLSGLYEIVPP